MQIYGERIGKLAILTPSSSSTIFDSRGQKVLLTRRTDNGRWCLPGGAMEPGETAAECCAREVLEETGLVICVVRLVGIYSSPHRIIEYSDGNQRQGLTLCFETNIVGGELGVSAETTKFRYFSSDQMKSMDVMESTKDWIADTFAGQEPAFVR